MSQKRRENRARNLARLRELLHERPASLPEIEMIELDRDIHLRFVCEGRVWDYWPSTGRAWQYGANRSTLLSPDELFLAVSSGIEPADLFPEPVPNAQERRVLRWLEKHTRH